MKEIKLLRETSVSFSFNPAELQAKLDASGEKKIKIGEAKANDILPLKELAEKNGAEILYATSSIESLIERALSKYFLGNNIRSDNRRIIFENILLQSNTLQFSHKKELLKEVLHKEDFLKGKDVNAVIQYLTNIQTWRNAFAHGTIRVLINDSPELSLDYFSGGPKSLRLDSTFFEQIEETFKRTRLLLNQLNETLSQK